MFFKDGTKPVVRNLITINEDVLSDWFFPLHRHTDELELSFVADGSTEAYIDGQSLSLKKGDLLIKNAGIFHSEKKLPGESLHLICISLANVHIEGLPDNTLITGFLSPVIHADTEPVIRDLFRYLEKHNSLTDDFRTDLACVLVQAICKMLPNREDRSMSEKDNSKRTIYNVQQYLDSHYAQSISLNQLSKIFFISPFHLSRKFKEYTGFTIKQYILDLRMGEAERLLMFTNLDIKDIALNCGYKDISYFYTQFRKYAQCTPVEFRRKSITSHES